MNTIIPYENHLKGFARELRKNQTPAEAFLWKEIRKQQLGVEFHRQVPILHYIVDFYCHEIGLVIEIDGRIHEHQVIDDGKRQGMIETYGVRFLRFKNDEVLNQLEIVISEIKQHINESLS